MLDTLKKDFEQLSLYTSTPGEGCTRLPFSAQAELSKKYIAKTMEGEGFDTAFDGVGNLRVRYSGSSPRLPALVIESHIDSVFNGGDFDGILGVLCGMEIFRSLKKKGFKPHRDILLVAFDGEEGCQFPSPYIGSRLATGVFDMEEIKLLRSPEGISYYDAALRAGYAPDTISQELLNTGIGEVFEIHVEQGEVLHKKPIFIKG